MRFALPPPPYDSTSPPPPPQQTVAAPLHYHVDANALVTVRCFLIDDGGAPFVVQMSPTTEAFRGCLPPAQMAAAMERVRANEAAQRRARAAEAAASAAQEATRQKRLQEVRFQKDTKSYYKYTQQKIHAQTMINYSLVGIFCKQKKS